MTSLIFPGSPIGEVLFLAHFTDEETEVQSSDHYMMLLGC